MTFLNDAGRIPLLTPEEEIVYGRLVQARQKILQENPVGPYTFEQQKALRAGKRAEDRMVKGNLRLVSSVLKKGPKVLRSLTREDLLNEGSIGLILAVQKFDPERGYKFSTYAYWWIRQSITRAIAEKDRTIRLPVNAHDDLLKLMKWMAKQKKTPTLEQCAEHLKTSKETVRLYLSSAQDVRSLDAKCSTDSETTSNLIDFIQDHSVDLMASLEDSLEDQRAWVEKRLDILPERDRKIMEMRLEGNLSRKEVAAKAGVHVSYVNICENRSIRTLKLEAGSVA